MIRRSMFLGASFWLATTMVAGAEIYTWTDDQGTLHFTEDASSVPSKVRSKARKTEANGEAAAEPAPAPQAAEAKVPAPAAKESTPVTEEERFDFTTRDQWQEELQRQEAAMTSLRQRIDDISATISKMQPTNERDNLLVEHRTLLAEFKTMKDRYYRLVEAARKAGFPVDMQQ